MSIRAFITDGLFGRLVAHVHSLAGQKAEHNGLLTLTDRFRQFNPEFHPFLNDTFGVAMNQNGGFGGTPIHIHDGTDDTVNEWTGSNIAGAGVTFDSTAQANTGTKSVLIDNEAAGNEWQFAKGSNQDLSGHTAITLFIYVDEKWGLGDSIQVQGFDVGVGSVGDAVLLEDYFDQFQFDVWQKLSIPFTDMGLTDLTIDAFRMEIVTKESSGPKWHIDDFQIEQTGSPIEYKSTTPIGTTFHITEIRIAIADNVTGIVTVAGATENHSMINLSYDKLLGLASLGTGVTFKRVQKDKTLFSFPINELGDFLSTGSNLINVISDGTNTFVTLLVMFPEPIVLEGGTDSFLSFTVNDDLTGLLKFTAAARGALEI